MDPQLAMQARPPACAGRRVHLDGWPAGATSPSFHRAGPAAVGCVTRGAPRSRRPRRRPCDRRSRRTLGPGKTSCWGREDPLAARHQRLSQVPTHAGGGLWSGVVAQRSGAIAGVVAMGVGAALILGGRERRHSALTNRWGHFGGALLVGTAADRGKECRCASGSLDTTTTWLEDRSMKEPSVAVLGAGALGAAMAARLGETGHQVNLWNRTPDRARAIATFHWSHGGCRSDGRG